MAKKRILIIEDDFDVAEMLIMYFRSHDYEILHAEDGRQGVEMAHTSFPSLILLDVMLPYIDGYEVCRQLRETSATKYIPIIFLTQRDERADRVRGLELGADDYITKPFDVDELALRVQASIRRATRTSLHEARTGLPGGQLVADELNQWQTKGDHHAEIRLGIDGLNAYSDVYGFIAADEVFGYAAQCIQQVMSTEGTPDDFVGVTDNQFIILTYVDDPQALEQKIKTHFGEGVKAFYNFIDVDRGGVILQPGTQYERLAPLMNFSTETETA
jgi:PleD family two-component response regulator